MLTAVPLAMAVLSPFAGRASDRFGSRQFLIGGSLLLALGSLLLIFSPSTSRPGELILDMAVLGAGLGFFTPANNRATMGATPREQLGMTGGFLNMMRSLGVILGVDISGMLFLDFASAHVGGRGKLPADKEALVFANKPAFMDGFHLVMMTLAALALLCALFSYFRKNDLSSKPHGVTAASYEIE